MDKSQITSYIQMATLLRAAIDMPPGVFSTSAEYDKYIAWKTEAQQCLDDDELLTQLVQLAQAYLAHLSAEKIVKIAIGEWGNIQANYYNKVRAILTKAQSLTCR